MLHIFDRPSKWLDEIRSDHCRPEINEPMFTRCPYFDLLNRTLILICLSNAGINPFYCIIQRQDDNYRQDRRRPRSLWYHSYQQCSAHSTSQNEKFFSKDNFFTGLFITFSKAHALMNIFIKSLALRTLWRNIYKTGWIGCLQI